MAINNTVKTNKVVKRVEADEPKVEKKKYAPDDEILTTSCTAGELILIGRKTGRLYDWANYGDKAMVEYQDIKAEQYISGSKYIYDPLFIIEDEEFLALPENKKIADVYEHALSADEIDELFGLDAIAFERTVKNLPKGIKNSLRSIAAEKVINGSLDSLQKIHALDEILGTDLFNCYVAS